jgi:predicted dehydrogenase
MKTVVLGLGRMGLRHLQAVRACGFVLAGAADPRPEARAEALSVGVPADLLCDDAETLLARTQPECVVIAATAPAHAPLTFAAVAAGAKRILCEKPMAPSPADCERMIAVCRDAGALLAINHQMRFMPEYTAIRNIVADPAFGPLIGISVTAGNCGLAMNAVHYVEAFRFLTGTAPESVVALLSEEIVPNPRGPAFEDRGGWMRLRAASGQWLNLEMDARQGHGMTMVCVGRNGQLMVDQQTGFMRLSVRRPENRALPTTRFWTEPEIEIRSFAADDVVASTAATLRALAAGADYPDGAVGRMAVAAVVAAHVSSEAGGAPTALTLDAAAMERRFPWA